MSVFEDLKQMDSSWKEAGSSDNLIPEGRYQATIADAILSESLRGAPLVNIKLRITGPTHINRFAARFYVLTEKALPYFKADLQILKVDLKNLADLPKALPKLTGKNVEINVKIRADKNNVDRNNIYLARLIEADDSQNAESELEEKTPF